MEDESEFVDHSSPPSPRYAAYYGDHVYNLETNTTNVEVRSFVFVYLGQAFKKR
jgi:hypothetical protein